MDNQTQPLGWTTLKQSKILVDAGIDVKTHDMYYDQPIAGDTLRLIPKYDFFAANNMYEHGKGRIFPCWSLGALMSMLTSYILCDKREHYALRVYKNGLLYKYFRYDRHYAENNVGFMEHDTLIANVVDAIVWLLKEGYMKKGE